MPATENTVIVTGAAGFIGYHTSRKLLQKGYTVVGIDNLNDYYDVSLKQARRKQLESFDRFHFFEIDIADNAKIQSVFQKFQPEYVVHLAAQAGVRYSLEHPLKYSDSNLTGFVNILEASRHAAIKHLIYASSSSVYGENKKVPFSTSDPVEKPINLYAATKRANELMAYTYSHLFRLPTTGLRFFTVYGPWGRPDMAYFKFAKAITEGQPIDVFNNGNMERDFTYIEDITEGICKVMKHIPIEETDGDAPYKLYNIGNNKPVKLQYFIEVLEEELGKKATKNFLPMQAGDMPRTFADIEPLMKDTGFAPQTSIEEGLKKFVGWYKEYYHPLKQL